jgi:hypothetical protein
MVIKTINKDNFFVEENEFVNLEHKEFNNLNILSNLGIMERIVSLIKELSEVYEEKIDLIYINSERIHGGYYPIKLSSKFNKVYVLNKFKSTNNELNLKNNILTFGVNNINIMENITKDIDISKKYIIFVEDPKEKIDNDLFENSIILSAVSGTSKNKNSYILSDSNYKIMVPVELRNNFYKEFVYFIDKENSSIINYDNLIHLAMIVKNAGDNFENILKENLEFIDRWTILDTGSTDNTINIIKKVLVGKKKGELYEEPFINFRDSRNRCFELAGTKCKFIVTLDDTYILKENLRKFLITVRGDQFSDSFSLFIKSNDSEYGSNRIIKSESKLRYKYKLHEVIDPKNNMNVIIPKKEAYIFDHRSDYMEKRTFDRKIYDLKVLFEMVEEEPDDSRALYYLGQTFNLLERYDDALKYFLLRIDHKDEGFIQEKIDACFEAARLCNFKLNKPWEECEKLYNRAYELDKSRPDSLYFIGVHYHLEKNFTKAYEYMKKAFELGYPEHCQYSLKPTLSFYYTPKFLAELSFMFNDSITGNKSTDLFLLKNEDDNSVEYYTMKCWHKIFTHINNSNVYKEEKYKNDKPLLVMLSDGGFSKWSGKDILTKGVGGSETFIIEISKYIQKSGEFNVIVFCNCEEEEFYEGVKYKNITEYKSFLKNNKVHSVIISRYPEYLPLTYNETHADTNIYLILHDLIPNGEVIIDSIKLKNIFCLTQYHCDIVSEMFEILKHKVIEFGYGVDIELFSKYNKISKVPYKFIYSSYPNRGLLQLLKMWKKIKERYPSATLHIHSDIHGNWVNKVSKNEMDEIKSLILDLQNSGIVYNGWTSKEKLYENWASSDVWFYPCTFLETFCLTALESAISKTLVITTNLGALKNTVSNRGVLINENLTNEENHEKALEILFHTIDNTIIKNNYILLNYEYAKSLSWENRSMSLVNDFLLKGKGCGGSDKEINNNHEESEQILKNFLNYFNFKLNTNTVKTTTLEIGDGTFLINYLNNIPNTNPYILSFYDNKIVNNIIGNVNINVCNKNDIYIDDKCKYDLIYINSDNNIFSFYENIVLSFKILKQGGILIIGKKYNKEVIDNFIRSFDSQIVVLHNSDRLYIEKK